MPSFIIVGGGIAGLAAASALKPCASKITVLERTPGPPREMGAAIQMKPNATRWLPALGVDLEALAPVEIHRLTQFDVQDSGEEVKAMDQQVDAVTTLGSPWLLTHRADLHKELLRAATGRAGSTCVKVVTGVAVHSVDPDSGIVMASDGRQWQADVVIGADGIHSKVREAVFPGATRRRPAYQAAYRCVIPASRIVDARLRKILLDPSQSGMKVWLKGDRRVVAYPCRRLDLINLVAVLPDPVLCPEAQRDVEALLDAETVQARGEWPQSRKRKSSTTELLADFSMFPDSIKDLLRAADPPSLWKLEDLDPLPSWIAGRVVLIGDAAHAMLPHMGQGGSSSIEDAAALRYIFHKASGAAPTVKLAEFEKLRKGHVHKIQAYSRIRGQPHAEEAQDHHVNSVQMSKLACGDPGFTL